MIETNGFNLYETARDLQIDVKTLSSWLKSKKHWCQLTTPLDDSMNETLKLTYNYYHELVSLSQFK